MTTARGWRRALAALLMIVMALAGTGRVAASAAPADAFGPLGPLGAAICHSGPRYATDGAPAIPGAPASSDRCDGCALMAPAVLPSPPSAAEPVQAARLVRLAPAGRPAPSLPRPRGPRQARGPPRV